MEYLICKIDGCHDIFYLCGGKIFKNKISYIFSIHQFSDHFAWLLLLGSIMIVNGPESLFLKNNYSSEFYSKYIAELFEYYM